MDGFGNFLGTVEQDDSREPIIIHEVEEMKHLMMDEVIGYDDLIEIDFNDIDEEGFWHGYKNQRKRMY